MRRITLLAAAAAVLATVPAARAQTPPLVLEVRGGYAVPTGNWNEDDTFENGLGLGANVMAMVSPQVGVYAGWEAFRFPVDEDDPGVDADATHAGFRAGVSVSAPVPRYRNVTPFLEAGVFYNTLEIEAGGNGTTVKLESEASIGFEAGVGFETALNQRISVVPMLRYRQNEVEFEDFGSESMQYVVAGVGLRMRL